MLQSPLTDADHVCGEKGDGGQARRHGQAGRGQGKALYVSRAGQEPRVVADNDIDEEGGENGKILSGFPLAKQSLVIVPQLAHRDLRGALQRAGDLFEAPGRKPGQNRQHKDDRPHGRDGARHLQRTDPKKDIRRFLHTITSGMKKWKRPVPIFCGFRRFTLCLLNHILP